MQTDDKKSTCLLHGERVKGTLDELARGPLSPTYLNEILAGHLSTWEIDPSDEAEAREAAARDDAIRVNSHTQSEVINTLIRQTGLQRISLPFPHRSVTRYAWGDVGVLELIQSVDPNGYFTHFTAVHLHGLTDQIPKTIYFNVEQKGTGRGSMVTQEGIDRAFKGKCRVSRNVIALHDHKVYRLNGKSTGKLGVIEFQPGPGPGAIQVTTIERTLIDAAVRPVYSGGVFEVAKAFEAAVPQLSLQCLANTLRRMDFAYPYHQTIGFYLERTGFFDNASLEPFRSFGLDFDFYLDYGIKNPEYCDRWRLYIPKRF